MKFLTIVVFIFFLLIFPSPAFAHTLKIDRAMGITLHVEPDDEPKAGTESKLYVEIEDSSGRFNPANPSNCACVLTIYKEGRSIGSLPVVNGGSYAQLRFTFPESGLYMITIDGKPTQEGQLFQAFTVSYEYYVKGDVRVASDNPLIDYIVYVEAIAVGLIVWIFTRIKASA